MTKKSEEKKALDQEQQANTENQDTVEQTETAENATDKNQAEEPVKEDDTSKKDKASTKKTKKQDAEKILALEENLKEQKDKFLRLYAEFENYRRRTSKEKLALSETASASLITKLLPVVDDYNRAIKAFADNEDLQSYKEGIDLIADKFWKILSQQGLEEIDSNNKEFNTDEHEAITQIPAPTEDLKGKVIDTTEKGYKLKEKVIRYAKVVVGN